jgi:predicted cupin superfamily sugar epimerase
MGCTVAPGFDYADFECGNRAELLAKYPGRTGIITLLTKE